MLNKNKEFIHKMVLNKGFPLIILVSSFLLTACPQKSTIPSVPEDYRAVLIDDLEDGNGFNEFRGTWFTYDDRNQEGDSKVIPTGYSAFRPSVGGPKNSSKYAQITGQVTTTFPDGFIGMGMDLNPDNMQPRNLSKYDAIEFWAKGDGKTYRMKIHSLVTVDYDDYGYDFTASPNWQRHLVKFDSLKQEGWGNQVERNQALSQALKIQWQTIGQPHDSIILGVDNIKLLKSQ
ncbi:MAG: CIA30 family protein [Prochloraceae cyanobacterium]